MVMQQYFREVSIIINESVHGQRKIKEAIYICYHITQAHVMTPEPLRQSKALKELVNGPLS